MERHFGQWRRGGRRRRQYHHRCRNDQASARKIHELIRERWSSRAFADKPVPQDVLRSIFEAARWAPSSNNEQPWAYIVATKDDRENFEKMLSVLVEFNANWARSAPVLA